MDFKNEDQLSKRVIMTSARFRFKVGIMEDILLGVVEVEVVLLEVVNTDPLLPNLRGFISVGICNGVETEEVNCTRFVVVVVLVVIIWSGGRLSSSPLSFAEERL